MSEMDINSATGTEGMREEKALGMADAGGSGRHMRSPGIFRTRSLSDGGGTPKLSPSPHIFEASRPQSQDDSSIRDSAGRESTVRDSALRENASSPSTPIRAAFSLRGLSLQVPAREAASPVQQSPQIRPTPLSPKLDHPPHPYASPTNFLPRRSRGLDFSRAATSLHHSTLADQASPDSSPTIGSRAMNIPGRRSGDWTADSNSLWSMMGNQERSHLSGSLGSNVHMCSDSSSTSEEDDLMDEDMEEGFIGTPQVAKVSSPTILHPVPGAPWMPGGSPAVNSLLNFQQRRRPRKKPRKKLRGPPGLGLSSGLPQPVLSRSPPTNHVAKEMASAHSRRESISWAANQLHISGSESDDNLKSQLEHVDSPTRPGVIKRAVTRRGSLLPKTKGFARIRAALAEESAPVETEVRREAEVVRQVRDSDMDLEPRIAQHSAATTAVSSPNLTTQDSLDDIPEDALMIDSATGPAGLGLSGSFKQHVLKNSKGRLFWDTFSEANGRAPLRVTPPPPLFGLARGSSSGLSLEDLAMDSPCAISTTGIGAGTFVIPPPLTTHSSSGHDTPQPTASQGSGDRGSAPPPPGFPPSAADITRRINSKRRRGADDDFGDGASFKRRAVSPGMSVHNSPVLQSPLQSWGSRPGSVGGDTSAKAATTPSENGSQGGGGGNGGGGNGGGGRVNGNKGRVGLQGMIDTNDGITKLSIE